MSEKKANSNEQFLDMHNLQMQPTPSSSTTPSKSKTQEVDSSPNESVKPEDLGFDFSELVQYLRKERLREIKITSTNKSKVGSYIISMSPTQLKARIRPRQQDEMIIQCDLANGKASLNGGDISLEKREEIAQLFDKINIETEKGLSKVDTQK